MQFKLDTSGLRWLLAGSLALAAAAAQAAGGYTVNRDQEAAVKVGMSQAEVQQAIGRPARTRQYRNEPGPTWTYEVLGGMDPAFLLDVDFDANGKVASVQERMEEMD